MEKEYLSEEKYQKISKKLFSLGVGIIILGVVVTLIVTVPKIFSRTRDNRADLQQQLSQLKPQLERRYEELKSNGVSESMDYKDKDGYEMFLIDTALDPTFDTCESSTRYSDNDTTREYCKVKAQLYNLDDPFERYEDRGFAIGILMPAIAIGLMLIFMSKRREIAAFQAQQVMPVAKEGIEKMAPTAGVVAKEISKGIKEGLNEDSEFAD